MATDLSLLRSCFEDLGKTENWDSSEIVMVDYGNLELPREASAVEIEIDDVLFSS